MDSDSTAWKYKQNVGISSEGPSTRLTVYEERSKLYYALHLYGCTTVINIAVYIKYNKWLRKSK
jgi:hypothetical protein